MTLMMEADTMVSATEDLQATECASPLVAEVESVVVEPVIEIPLGDLRDSVERVESRGVLVDAVAAIQRVRDLPLGLYVRISNMDNTIGHITEAMVMQKSIKSKIAGRVACQAMFSILPYAAGAIDLVSYKVFGYAPVSHVVSHALIGSGGPAAAPIEAHTTSYLEPNPTTHGGVLEQAGDTPVSSVLELPNSKPGEYVSEVFEAASPKHGDQIMSQAVNNSVQDGDIIKVQEPNGVWFPEAAHAQTVDGVHIADGATDTPDMLRILAEDPRNHISLESNAHSTAGGTGVDTPRGVNTVPTDLPNGGKGLMEISGGSFPVYYDPQHQLGYVQLTPGMYGPDGHNYITFDETSPTVAQQLAEHGLSFQGSGSSYGLIQTGVDRVDLYLPSSVRLSFDHDGLHFTLKDGTDVDVSRVSLERVHAIDADGTIDYANAEPVIEAAFKSRGYHITFYEGRPADIVHIVQSPRGAADSKMDGPLHIAVSGGDGQVTFAPDPTGTTVSVEMHLPPNELYNSGAHTAILGAVDGYVDQRDYVHLFSDSGSGAQQELNSDFLSAIGWKSTIVTNGHGVVTEINLSSTQSAPDVLQLPGGYSVNVANIGVHGPNTGQLIVTPPLGVGDGYPITVDLPSNAFDGHGNLVNLNSPNIHQAIQDAAERDDIYLRFPTGNVAVVVDPPETDNSIWSRLSYGLSLIWSEYRGGIIGASFGTVVLGSLWKAVVRWSEGRNILTGRYDWKKNILEKSRTQSGNAAGMQYVRRRRGLPRFRIEFDKSAIKPDERVLFHVPVITMPSLDGLRALLQRR
ncbi:MAG TPA: hypothetical protein VMB52_03360, partial [Verrucomicrobiae bacterium]|nr:hypothetical protein [Verrucomicrobiae bacterium]